jgi:dye decolorizing peroxidase
VRRYHPGAVSDGSILDARLPRRSLLLGACGAVAAGAAWSLRRTVTATDTAGPPAGAGRHGSWFVLDVTDDVAARLRTPDDLTATATDIADRVAAGRDVTATLVGFGPRLVAAVDPTLPGAEALPAFASDHAIARERRGGDLAVLVESSLPVALDTTAVPDLLGLAGASVRWRVDGRRGGARARNAFGFHDEVEVPGTDDELREHVLVGDPRVPGATLCVLRLLELDVAGFGALGVEEQEAVIGRRRSDGAPLSGGTIEDPVDLQARGADGSYAIPERAHVRAAHPLYTGSSLMLRRSYDVADDDASAGDGPAAAPQMLFTSYQRELATFVATQRRLDETDDLMRFVTPIGSASFLVVPAAGRSVADVLLPHAVA